MVVQEWETAVQHTVGGRSNGRRRCREQARVRRLFVIVLCSVITFGIPGLGGGSAEESNEPNGMVFSTIIGGSRWDEARDVAADGDGNSYITGGTASSDYTVTKGAYQTSHNPGSSLLARLMQKVTGRSSENDAFAAKLDARGNIIWSTFIGGPSYDPAYTIWKCVFHRRHIFG